MMNKHIEPLEPWPSPPKAPYEPPTSTEEGDKRVLLMAIRQALIMILGAIEDYLQIERSIIPRRKRQ